MTLSRGLLLLIVLLTACTKPNRNVCCIEEADCMAKGIPVGSVCAEGLLCRGNQCIAQVCTAASECDASAPYCADGACAEACATDTQCPGLGQLEDARFCAAGQCIECRENSECSATAPVCDTGSCRACRAHGECPSGVCADDGTCAAPEDIAYVDVTGAAMTDCTVAATSTVPEDIDGDARPQGAGRDVGADEYAP